MKNRIQKGLGGLKILNKIFKLYRNAHKTFPKRVVAGRKYGIKNYPGYMISPLMRGSSLEKLLSKRGTISITSLLAQAIKGNAMEKDIINKVIRELIMGKKAVDYNFLRKAVLDELIQYTRKPQSKWASYGMDRLGFTNKTVPDGAGGNITYTPGITTRTFTFESPMIPNGNSKHFDPTSLGHTRTYVTPEEPDILHILESQSDWAQKGNFKINTDDINWLEQKILYLTELPYKKDIGSIVDYEDLKRDGNYDRLLKSYTDRLNELKGRTSYHIKYLADNYLQRQLLENLKYAAEQGYTKMRYPTSETSAKIEKYKLELLVRPTQQRESELRHALHKLWVPYYDQHVQELSKKDFSELEDIARLNIPNYANFADELEQLESIPDTYDYSPKNKSILKKYENFPKMYEKLYGKGTTRIITDSKGNSWYEVDIPSNFLLREILYKSGGKLNMFY